MKPFNINEYNISSVINNPDSLALRSLLHWKREAVRLFSFVMHLDSDR